MAIVENYIVNINTIIDVQAKKNVCKLFNFSSVQIVLY